MGYRGAGYPLWVGTPFHFLGDSLPTNYTDNLLQLYTFHKGDIAVQLVWGVQVGVPRSRVPPFWSSHLFTFWVTPYPPATQITFFFSFTSGLFGGDTSFIFQLWWINTAVVTGNAGFRTERSPWSDTQLLSLSAPPTLFSQMDNPPYGGK